MKYNEKVNEKNPASVAEEGQTEAFLDRTQILRSIKDAYGSGRPVERVMRERMAVVRAGIDPESARSIVPDTEFGTTYYRRRKCGKVASFFRCLLR